MTTFQNGIGLQNLLLNPRVLATDGRQVLQDQLGALRFSGSRLTTEQSKRTKKNGQSMQTVGSRAQLFARLLGTSIFIEKNIPTFL